MASSRWEKYTLVALANKWMTIAWEPHSRREVLRDTRISCRCIVQCCRSGVAVYTSRYPYRYRRGVETSLKRRVSSVVCNFDACVSHYTDFFTNYQREWALSIDVARSEWRCPAVICADAGSERRRWRTCGYAWRNNIFRIHIIYVQIHVHIYRFMKCEEIVGVQWRLKFSNRPKLNALQLKYFEKMGK